jgi:hypothetical protein
LVEVDDVNESTYSMEKREEVDDAWEDGGCERVDENCELATITTKDRSLLL